MSRARARGFTLIEVLLATMLLASGLALGFATVRAATATAQRGEAMAEHTERMRAVEGFLRRRLAAAQPIAFGEDTSNGGALRFIGEADRIRFVADLPSYLGRGGPHLHDIAVVGRGDDATLAVSFTMVLAGETIEEDQPRPPEPLVTGLTGLRIRYRGIDADSGEAVWLDAWDAYEELPLQVSIEIESRPGGAWPALVVALPQASSTPQFGGGRSRMGGMRPAPRMRSRPAPDPGTDARRGRLRDPAPVPR
jgi:general secretion pathway protein J